MHAMVSLERQWQHKKKEDKFKLELDRSLETLEMEGTGILAGFVGYLACGWVIVHKRSHFDVGGRVSSKGECVVSLCAFLTITSTFIPKK